MKKTRNFNLLKPLQPPSTAWDRVYEWLIGKARIVILITELIVASSFALKVIVDTTAKNKDREIDRLTNELSFFAIELEPQFRKLQSKSDTYALIWNSSNEYNPVLQEITSLITNETSEVSISIQGNTLRVLGFEDINSIEVFENAIKSSPNFTDVVVDDLSLNQSEIQQNKGRYALSAKIIESKREQL